MFWVYVKSIVISLLVITIISFAAWLYQSQPSENQHMQTWINSTQDLLQGAKGLFSNLEQPEEDEKLKALLPSEQLDLSYRPDPTLADIEITSQQGSVPSISISDARELLPDMFNAQAEPGTSVKGQVHTDENDNIIGAEVHVAIPADM